MNPMINPKTAMTMNGTIPQSSGVEKLQLAGVVNCPGEELDGEGPGEELDGDGPGEELDGDGPGAGHHFTHSPFSPQAQQRGCTSGPQHLPILQIDDGHCRSVEQLPPLRGTEHTPCLQHGDPGLIFHR